MAFIFSAQSATTLSMAVSQTSTSVTLSGVGNAVLLTNTGTNPAYVQFLNTSPAIATGAGIPVIAAQPIVVRRDVISDLYIGAVCDSGQTTTLKVTKVNI